MDWIRSDCGHYIVQSINGMTTENRIDNREVLEYSDNEEYIKDKAKNGQSISL